MKFEWKTAVNTRYRILLKEFSIFTRYKWNMLKNSKKNLLYSGNNCAHVHKTYEALLVLYVIMI